MISEDNLDSKVISDFGDEWAKYGYESNGSSSELALQFQKYSELVNFSEFDPQHSTAADFGAGTGRWAQFILENGKYNCGSRLEKMSKRYFNVVNPDDIVERYGADTFRMYEMFLGPVEQDKPWDTKGIEGVHRFLKKVWRLFVDEEKGKVLVTDAEPNASEWKALYRMIKKVDEDTERFSFNTAVSTFMIGANELSDLKCHKRKVLEKFAVSLAAYAPHMAEELWQILGKEGSVLNSPWPGVEDQYLVETSKVYPVAINGKTRSELSLSLDATQQQVEELVLADDTIKKWLEGRAPKKVIYVKNKMINLVV